MLKKLLLSLFSLSLLFSCTTDEDLTIPEEQSGNVSFAFTNLTIDEDSNKSSKNLVDAIPDAIYINIIDASGASVIDYQRLTLLTFGSGYVTNNLELPVGDYEITVFNVVDANNEVIYASPLAGSEYGEFVNNPLPIAFSVTNNETNNVSPEVIFVGETTTPELFGYTSFSFTVVDVLEPETQDLYLSANELVNGDYVETEGYYTIEIPSQNFQTSENLFIDHIPITIPITTGDDLVKITVHLSDYYSDKVFYLNAFQIAQYSADAPYEIYFEAEVSVDETQNLYIKLYEYDAGNNPMSVDGEYRVSINSLVPDYFDEEYIPSNGLLLELPMTVTDNGEVVSLTIIRPGQPYQYFDLTAEEIANHFNADTAFEVFFDYVPQTQSKSVTLFKWDATTDSFFQTTGSYTIEATSQNFYSEGTIDTDVFELQMPYISGDETITLSITEASNSSETRVYTLTPENVTEYLGIYF